jgi:hypothetical protein
MPYLSGPASSSHASCSPAFSANVDKGSGHVARPFPSSLHNIKPADVFQRISLNWPLDAQGKSAFFGRKLFHQEIIQKPPHVVNDDVWTFNSQVSSQWDGLRHFAYQKEQKFYGGITMDDIHGVGGGLNSRGERTKVLGIHSELMYGSKISED